jgi:hypothetical protein
MNLTYYMTGNYDNKSGLLPMEKQTQSNPICSELARPELACGEHACTELCRSVEPFEGVEPISKWRKPCGASHPVDFICLRSRLLCLNVTLQRLEVSVQYLVVNMQIAVFDLKIAF